LVEQQNMPPEPQSGDAPQAEAEAPARGSVGALLKASRIRLGIDLAAIAETLRIRLVYLEAIETGRYEDLPGGTYAVGFIRSYGDQLGLDGMELVRRFKLETGVASPVAAQTISFPEPVTTLGLPIGAIVTGVVVAGALLAGGWLLFSSNDRASLMPKIPAALNEKVGTPEPAFPPPAVKPEGEARPEPAAEPEKAEPPKPEPPKVETAKPAKPEPVKPEPAKPTKPEPAKAEPPKPVAEAAKPAAKVEAPKPVAEAAKPAESAKPAAKAEPPKSAAKPAAEEAEDLPETPETLARGPRVYGQENDNARVEIVASGDSWVQVTENGSLVLTRLLHPGDRFKVPNRSGLLLMTGNAGGLDVIVDGQKVGTVGAAGQVMRDVQLDAERLRAGRKTTN
jgi:cytoskeleton protein RodZ